MPGLISQVSAWAPPIEATATRTALEVVRAVASKLIANDVLQRAIEETQRQTAFPRSVQWFAHSVAQGYAGLALLWAQMDACFPDEGWDLVGREHLALAARDLEQYRDIQLGIFSGLTGVAFAAWQLSRGGTRYHRLLQTLDHAIIPQTVALAKALDEFDGCSVSHFDAISGLAGIGAYLLCRTDDAACRDCLSIVLSTLVGLLNSSGDLPRWHTPGHFIGDERSHELYPHGWLNCGLAHGIPGPLALLSLAHANGVSVKNLPEAVTRTADWLCEHRLDDRWGTNWPTAVSISCDDATGHLCADAAQSAPGGPSRCAWCYGSPGIARALWLAGQAVECERYQDIAISAIQAVFRRPVKERRIDSPSFCHGVAGLLQITLRFANEVDAFYEDINALVHQIIDRFSPQNLVGFRNLEIGTNEIDQPGFLDGAAGIAAVLLAAATNVGPTWDRLFLLA